MRLDEIEVGYFLHLLLGTERDPRDRRQFLTRSARVQVIRISPTSGRVTVRLVEYPRLRARSVKPDRLIATWHCM